MSLIQEALKRKAEERGPLPPGMPQKPQEPPALRGEKAPETKTKAPETARQKQAGILAAAIVLILLSIGARLYFHLNQSKTATAETDSSSQPPAIETDPPPAPEPVQSETQKPPTAAPPVAAPAPQPVVESSPEPAESAWPDLSFSGTAAGGNQILAVINGRMLSVGDRINGVEVLQIGKTEVLVEYNSEKRVLNIDDE